MEEMIFDKCGGMAVLGAMSAVARLKLKRNVVGIIASAENMPGGKRLSPRRHRHHLRRQPHRRSINTDAEGRVVLADAIAYARKDLHAAAIIDLATLTGACGVALGEYAAGFWSNDDAFGERRPRRLREGRRAALAACRSFTEYDDQIKSEVAGLKNTGGRLGGACTGAAFLKAFARRHPLGAPRHRLHGQPRKRPARDLARGATGFGVRTLVELAEG